MFNLIQFTYLLTAAFLIFGLRQMSSPKTAKRGIYSAGWAMLVAVGVTFFLPTLQGG